MNRQQTAGTWRRLAQALLGAATAMALLSCGGGGSSGVESGSGVSVQGVPGREQAANVEGAPIYRFAKISTGAYFYTGSKEEADFIRANLPDFRYEGIAFQQSAQAGGTPVFRFANLANGGYFYTASVAERDATILNYPNMRYEGSTFSVAGGSTAGALPVYRLANLNNGAYLFTSSPGERDYAISLGNWRDEGTTFSAVPGSDPECEARLPWRVVSGPRGCVACVELGGGSDGGPGGESGGGESVGAGAAWSQVRNMLARVTKPDGSLLGEAQVSEGLVSIYPGCYRGPYVVEFIAQSGAEYFDEARLAWRPIPATNGRLRVAMPAYLVGRDLSANPFTEAAYQFAAEYDGGAGLTAGNITAANERVRNEVNTKLLFSQEFGARVRAALRESRAGGVANTANTTAVAVAEIEDITRLPKLINDQTSANTLGNTPRGIWAAQIAAFVKAAYSFSGNTLENPAVDFTNHLVQDILDNGSINPETTVEKQTYGPDSPARTQVEIVRAAEIWGTGELQTQVEPPNPLGCTNATVGWRQGSNSCSASVSGQYGHNATTTLNDITGSQVGTATATCSNGAWVATGSCATSQQACTSGTVGWTQGANQCSASVPSGASGATVNVQDLTGTTGAATATCSNGTWSATGTCAAAVTCAATTLGWAVGENNCSAAVPNTTGGVVLILDDTTGTTGSARAQCNGGTWSVTPIRCNAEVIATCPASTLSWTVNGNTCSAPVQSAASGYATTLLDTDIEGNSGTATATCTNGSWVLSQQACSAPPKPCNAAVASWFGTGSESSLQCSAHLNAAPSGTISTIYDQTEPNYGQATLSCFDGVWTPGERSCSDDYYPIVDLTLPQRVRPPAGPAR